MQASDLLNIIAKFPSISDNFVGIFSINNVPKRVANNHFLIVNTEESSKPGKHWFCFIKRETKKYELFDSLGIDQTKLNVIEEFKIFPPKSIVKFNENEVQDSQSITCGLFVLYFLVNRMHNLDMSFSDLINEIFDLKPDVNETLVNNFSQHHFFS